MKKLEMYRCKGGVIRFKGMVNYMKRETKEVVVDGEIYTKTKLVDVNKMVSELDVNLSRNYEYEFKDLGITEVINDFTGLLENGLCSYGQYSQREGANRILTAFNDGVLDSRIIDLTCGKHNRLRDNDYNVSKGYYSFQLLSYGYNNTICYSVKIDDLQDINTINNFDRDRLENYHKVLNQSKCYIIKDVNTGFYKIGKSKNPKNREKTLQAEKPTIKIIKIFRDDIESKLHRIYNSQRIRGEWFNLSKIQVKYICTHY